MLKEYIPARWDKYEIYTVVFDQGDNRGLMFPCDKDGNLADMSEDEREKYDFCMEHPELFSRFNQVVKFEVAHEVVEKGVCECGYTVFLRDAGMFGTCVCPQCKRVYDIRGREHRGMRVCA